MKVLSVAWRIFDSRIEQYANNYTGGGLIIKNLCEYIGKSEESYLFLGSTVLPSIKFDNLEIIKTDYIPSKKSIKGKNSEYIEYLTDIFDKTVKDINPDIINFHGYGDMAFSFIEKVCLKRNLKFVVTDHLFVGKAEQFGGYSDQELIEHKLYNYAGLSYVAVSNGMKQKIMKFYPHISDNQIKVILNGTDFTPKTVKSDLIEKHNLEGKKILLCAGTINERKNQLSLVKLFSVYPNLKDKISILFCGKDSLGGKLQEEIKKSQLTEALIYCGAVSNQDIKKYYSISDGVIMPSYAEGLSITLLEGLRYGLPIVMNSDSECALDINDKKIVSFAEDRSAEAMFKAITNWYNTNWDKKYIIEFSQYFTMERMAEDYINYYNGIICQQ